MTGLQGEKHPFFTVSPTETCCKYRARNAKVHVILWNFPSLEYEGFRLFPITAKSRGSTVLQNDTEKKYSKKIQAEKILQKKRQFTTLPTLF